MKYIAKNIWLATHSFLEKKQSWEGRGKKSQKKTRHLSGKILNSMFFFIWTVYLTSEIMLINNYVQVKKWN